jgi:hypothetical protein
MFVSGIITFGTGQSCAKNVFSHGEVATSLHVQLLQLHQMATAALQMPPTGPKDEQNSSAKNGLSA